ncbi:DNA-3-methyladenine glycosylase family protein [Salipaludibacillus agaradhaerens]|uniref:DNA-3-methyladenine glycosylase family protein n=1 Tax=Salipaludibacillus agaradhaerens TaxID=76935 RepID=UPI0021517C53|nr:DNA-3-methyladenine glycosylase [Salipaludibacillus agaradhaerens]
MKYGMLVVMEGGVTMEWTHMITGPYNFNQALKRLKIDLLLTLNVVEETLTLPIWIEDNPVTVTVKQLGTFEEPMFHIQVTDHEKVTKEAITEKLTHLFHWDTPLAAIADFFEKTELALLFQQYRGTPFVCDSQLYGSLMKTIIHQQLNMAFAYTLTERFVKSFGFQHEGAWFYPSPEKVANLEPAQLRELQFSQRKAEYVIDTSRMIAEGDLNLNELVQLSNEQVIETLVKIRGIGPWTAENFLMFGLGRMDLFPIQDIGIQNAMKKFYNWEAKPLHAVMLEKSKEWKPYRTYASLYLWESIET